MVHFGDAQTMQEATSSLLVPLRLTTSPGSPFDAEVTDASIGPVVIAKMAYTPGRVRRLPRLINSGDPPLTLITLQRRGRSIVAQDDRQCHQGSPGDMVAYDTRRPYDLVCPDRSELVVIAMPHEMLGPSGDLISRRTAVSVPSDAGIRSVIATFFNGLADTALAGANGELGGPSAARLADTTVSLIVTAFTSVPGESVETPTDLADRILSYALANLHDPGLSVESVARSFSISSRYLHTLMRRREIRFGAWVRRERMRRIRRDLLDAQLAHVTAAAIAARWGIQDPDHLGRSLRAEFGQSAAEIRSDAVSAQ